MSQGGYTQTILLDANRLSSEEFLASNLAQTDNAIFTNKVSNGITIDIGDQVSIQSAHIAQRGAGGSVIQMDGDVLGEKEITTTETINSSYIGYDKSTDEQGYSPTGYAYETSSNESQKVKMKDNEASIVLSYYKTANGENNIGLPRNWGSASMGNAESGGDPSGAGLTNASFWSASDSYAKGCNTYYFTASHVFTPDFEDQIAWSIINQNAYVRKLKQDNSKYTIFKRSEIVYRQSEVSSASNASYLQPVPTKPDPALGNYNRLLQKVKLNIPAGYNSPSSISSDVTNQLTKTEPSINIIGDDLTSVLNSTVYKAFPCANYNFFSASGNEEFFNSSINTGLPDSVGTNACNTARAVNYLTNYSHIGFKRPDFVESGRNTGAYHGSALVTQINQMNASTAEIRTNITWSEDVLLRFKNFFDSQRFYPELLDHATTSGNSSYSTLYPNATSASLNASFRKEARFLHIGISGSGNNGLATDALGSDMYNVPYISVSQTTPTQASDSTSMPIFFYFNESSSHLTSEETIGDRVDNLAYGFARRWNDEGLYKIAFITEPIGGIPISYFGEQGGAIKTNTKIGYDYHFSAYGNSAIMLSSGFSPLQYYGQIQYQQATDIRQVYLGADNILLNFDTVQSRFELSNLHSAEKVGNFYTAGDPNPSANVFAPPPSSQAGQDCFKINKQLKYDTWSPSMHPYTVIDLSGSATDGTQKTFIPMNINMVAGTIYDAHGGICIEDMGIDERSWKRSIWGILGFEYGQFNASGGIENIKNINNRFSNVNPNSSGITTNADVTSLDSQQFHSNPYATNMFNAMLGSNVNFYNTPQTIGTANARFPDDPDHKVSPAIVIVSNSTKIIASELPRKILKGYFLINSDILDTANYYQLANPLQTMAVVGKYNANNDFISYDGGGAVFTATRKKTITSIKTQILDPEGGTANVGDNSGIIYRIDKMINTDLRFAETLMAQMNSKK